MRTKQEVVDFLESKVGTKVLCKGNPSLDGQCVTLIKALMEFLGVPDPYKARGHAKTVIDAYLSEGIADPGLGFLSVFSNKNMAAPYGHIWLNAGEGDGVFYESNGAKPLITTKGKTYAYDNVCNFDKYIGDNMYTEAQMSEVRLERDKNWNLYQAELKKNQELKNQLADSYTAQENLRKIIKELESNPITTPNELPVTWIPNGMAVTTEENGVKKTINYAVKQA